MWNLVTKCAWLVCSLFYGLNFVGLNSHSVKQYYVSKTPPQVVNNTNNWSGYVLPKDQISSISGSFIVPEISSSDSPVNSANSTWLGIGGTKSSDLIQTGVQSMNINGTIENSAFYEILPASTVYIPNFSVNGGDEITSSISLISQNNWQIELDNITSGQTFKKDISYISSQSSAEWIEEDPSSLNNELPFDDFRNTTFSNLVVNGQKLNVQKSEVYNLMDKKNNKIVNVSKIQANSFSISRNLNFH